MSDVVVLCITLFGISALACGTYLYLKVTERTAKVASADFLQSRAEGLFTGLQDMQDRLEKALGRLSLSENALNDSLSARSQSTADAILAFSERMVLFESALKDVIAQMTNVTGYSATKYQELLAAQVRRSTSPKRPGTPG